MKRAATLAAAVACATATAGCLASSAAAHGTPTITHLTDLPAVFTDDSLCSFDVQVSGADDVVIQDFFDADGNLTREVFHDQFLGTVSANGFTLLRSESATIVDDYVADTETWTGVAERYTLPDGTIVEGDSGKVVFDGISGDVLSQAGPHPLLADTGAVCQALGG